jgi:NitT/TauT family transport system substrate-binding protein
MTLSRRTFVTRAAAGALAPAATFAPGLVRAAQRVRYAFPAPAFLAAFTPINIAQIKGYYAEAGLEVEFQSVAGGLDAAKRVIDGEFDLGGGTGDTPILLRPQGLPIKAVAVLGGKSMTQMVVRREAGIYTPEGFRGKKISVTSTTDTTYYTLLGFLAAIGVAADDVTIVPSGPINVFKHLIDGQVDAMAGVPDWVVPIQRSGVRTMIFRSDEFFPSLAQALLSSDAAIARRPDAINAFVRATVRGLQETIRAPQESAKLIADTFPQQKGKADEIADVIRYYADYVYPGQRRPGEMNALRLEKVQTFYRNRNIIAQATPVRDLYAPQFTS